MENVAVPIVTISATFQGIFPEFQGSREEIVYSRAHYSQALACLIAAARLNQSAWLIDPSNYVSKKDWPKIVLTEKIAELLARTSALKTLKGLLDKKAGGKLPIASAILDPLKYVTARTQKPILSVHYATGNILASQGKPVLEIVTDPFVRPSYLEYASEESAYFAVFDKATKDEFIQKAQALPVLPMNKELRPLAIESLTKRVFVTGPPVDPRIVDVRKSKSSKNIDNRPLRLAITTGGVGTNKSEIKPLLQSLAQRLQGKETTLQVIAYAGTHPDFQKMYTQFAKQNNIPIGKLKDDKARFRIISARNLFEANELLVKHLFPWTDAIITKPSGDMAYDAVASGTALFFLSPIGDWENRIRDIFVTKNCAVSIDPENFASQLTLLEHSLRGESSKLKSLIKNSLTIDKLYLTGAENIVKTLLKLK